MTELYHEDQTPQQLSLFITSKICSACGVKKMLDNFPRSNTKDGYDPRCKACRADYHAIYREKHRAPKSVEETRPGEKFCKRCEQWLALERFPVRGKRVYRFCMECSREYYREYTGVKKPRLQASQEGHKICTACKKELPFEQFHLQKGKPKAECIECERARDKARHPIRNPRKTPIKPKPTKPDHKVCNACREEKPLKSFKKTSLFKDGHAGTCKQCEARERATRTAEEKEQEKIRKQAYREDHLEEIRKYDRQRFKNNPSRRLQHEKHNRLRNRLIYAEEINFQDILERDGYWCYICESSIDPSVKEGPARLVFDHVLPLVPRRGELQGTHIPENIKPAHKICNQRKSNKPLKLLTLFDRRGI